MQELRWHPEALIREVDMKEDKLLELSADSMLTDAIAEVPVDTGTLQASLRREVDNQEKTCYVGSDLEYSVFVEYGTRNMAAQPYLRPAFDNMFGKADAMINKVSQI